MARSTKLAQNKGKLASKRSKTADPACSKAVSDWKTSGMTPEVASVLGKCRAKARMKKQAESQRGAGNETKAQVLDKRAERGLTVKDRVAKAKELIAQRKAGIAAKAAPVASATSTTAKGSQARKDQAAILRAEYRTQSTTRSRQGYKANSNVRGPNSGGGKEIKAQSRAQSEVSTATRQANAVWDRVPSDVRTRLREKAKASAERQKAGARFAAKPQAKPATPQNPRAARLERLGAKTNEAKGLLAYERVKRADALRTQRQQAAKPSLLDQARQTRAAKGDRTSRLNSLANKAMSKAEKFGTKANSLTGAAEDRAVDRMNAFQDRFYALDKAARPGTPAPTPAKSSLRAQAEAARAKKGSREERVAKLKERASGLVEKRFDRAFAASEGARSNYVDLGSIRRNLGSAGYNYDAYKAGINSLRRQGKVSLDSFEGIRGKLTERQMAGSITEGPANGVANRLVWASYRDGKAPMLTAAAKKKRTSRQFRANA